MNSRATRVGTSEVCVPTHVALRMFIMRVLASQLHFMTNRNAGLTLPPLLWPFNCIKIGVHVEQPSGPTVHSLYCDQAFNPQFLGGKIIELAKFCFKNKRFEPSLSFFSKPVTYLSLCVKFQFQILKFRQENTR